MKDRHENDWRIASLRIGDLEVPVESRELDVCGHWRDMKIVMSSKIKDKDIYFSSLLHESIHAIAELYGIKLKESQVRVLEMSIFSLMKNNPKLSAYLSGEERDSKKTKR